MAGHVPDRELLLRTAAQLAEVCDLRRGLNELQTEGQAAKAAAAKLRRAQLLEEWDRSSADLFGCPYVLGESPESGSIKVRFDLACWSARDEIAAAQPDGADTAARRRLFIKKDLVTRLLGRTLASPYTLRNGRWTETLRHWSETSWLSRPKWLQERLTEFQVDRRDSSASSRDASVVRRTTVESVAEEEKQQFLSVLRQFGQGHDWPFEILGVHGAWYEDIETVDGMALYPPAEGFRVQLVALVPRRAVQALVPQVAHGLLKSALGEDSLLALAAGGVKSAAYVALATARPRFRKLADLVCEYLPSASQVTQLARDLAAERRERAATENQAALRILSGERSQGKRRFLQPIPDGQRKRPRAAPGAAELSQAILELLRERGQDSQGVSVRELLGELPWTAEQADVRAVLEVLVTAGRACSTIDDDHFLLAC